MGRSSEPRKGHRRSSSSGKRHGSSPQGQQQRSKPTLNTPLDDETLRQARRRCGSCGGWGLGVVRSSGFCGHCTRTGQAAASEAKTQRSDPTPRESKQEAGDVPVVSESATAATGAKSFADLGLIPQLVEACESMNYKRPTPIQEQSIPPALEGRDIIGLAQTGSGKTAAFALPVLQALMEDAQPLFACVLSPTRELAVQISRQFESLGSVIGVRCAVIVGGVDKTAQAIALARRPHVVVGTPGRVLEHLEHTKGFHLRTLKYLVLDEADRLLSMDFEEEINKILSLVPRDRRTMLFSATMTSKVQKLQRASVRNPVRVEVTSKFRTVDKLLQEYMFIPAKHKDSYLVFLLNEFAGQSTIVFVATRKDTQRLALMLRNLGFGAIPLHGQLNQSARFGSLNKFSSGDRSVLIATDVAGRGLDIPLVDLVINYDIPANAKDYIHRVGRTARAERAGRTVALVSQYDVELYQRIETHIGKKLPLFECDKDEVMILQERVEEAQRFAALELRESGLSGRDRAGAGDDDDSDAEMRVKKRKSVRSGGGTKAKRRRG